MKLTNSSMPNVTSDPVTARAIAPATMTVIFTTTSGDVTLHVSKLKGVQFETAIIERYRRRETSIEEALIEMYLAGVSVRRGEDITEALWGTRVSSGTVIDLKQKAYGYIEKWLCRPLTGDYAYVYVDGVYLKRSWGGEIQNVSVLVAIGVGQDGRYDAEGHPCSGRQGSRPPKGSYGC